MGLENKFLSGDAGVSNVLSITSMLSIVLCLTLLINKSFSEGVIPDARAEKSKSFSSSNIWVKIS